MRLPRFFAPDAPEDGMITLPEEEAHHLRHVLRLPVGSDVRVFDGRGREWQAVVADAGRRQVKLRISEEVAAVREPRVRLTLGIGLLKGDQMDVVVRDATALGVAAVAPLLLDHVAVPRVDRGSERAERAVSRWQRVAIAAAKQCGRAVVPEILEPMALDDLIDRIAADAIVIALEPEMTKDRAVQAAGTTTHESRSLASVDDAVTGPPGSAVVLVGPEGGWSDAELSRVSASGARTLSLGPRTLRAETAPVVSLAALWTRWGW